MHSQVYPDFINGSSPHLTPWSNKEWEARLQLNSRLVVVSARIICHHVDDRGSSKTTEHEVDIEPFGDLPKMLFQGCVEAAIAVTQLELPGM